VNSTSSPIDSASPFVADKRAVVARNRRPSFRSDRIITTILVVLGFITFLPFIMLLQLSLKSEQQMADSMWLPAWPLKFTNYYTAYQAISAHLLNSVLFVVGVVSISIVCSVLSAYVLARYDFPGREFFYTAILAMLMIPWILTLITTFTIVISLNLNNTLLGVWLPLAATAQAFQIIVLRTFFASLPPELFEAGRIDGASEVTMLIKIALPLSKPIVATLVVLQTMAIWNEYIWPIMVLSNSDLYPAIVEVWQLGEISNVFRDVGAQNAAFVLVSLPILILFVFASRTFIRGLTSGAIKM
jgi:ABC-type glycerol-3-phosphate transport system permease component